VIKYLYAFTLTSVVGLDNMRYLYYFNILKVKEYHHANWCDGSFAKVKVLFSEQKL